MYILFFGNIGEESNITKYRHKLLNNSVVFGTPVACEYDLSCYTLTADSIYGPAMIQIQNMINNIVNPSLNLKAPINNPTFTGTVGGITKAMIQLDAIENTSDLAKPISTATQTALNLKADLLTTYTKTEVDIRLDTKQIKFLLGEIPPTNSARLFDHSDNKFRAIYVNSPLSIETTNDAYLTIRSDSYNKAEVNNALALKAPINNPTFTGTIVCPQLNATNTKTDFNEIKPPGLYHYNGLTLPNAPSTSQNFRTIEIGGYFITQ